MDVKSRAEDAAIESSSGDDDADLNHQNTCRQCNLPTEIPKIPMYGPYNLHLEPGKLYSWCSCGLSKSQPWCDQSHKGTNFRPVRFRVTTQQSFHSICGCKYTENPPFCDARHAILMFQPDYPPCHCLSREKELQCIAGNKSIEW